MSVTPPKIVELVQRALKAVKFLEEEAPVGCHYFFSDPEHEVTLFVSATEIVGGPQDGMRIESKFYVDMLNLLDVLDVTDGCTWQTRQFDNDDELSAHVSLTGTYRGEPVWLRVLAESPAHFLPGRIADSTGEAIADLWGSPTDPS